MSNSVHKSSPIAVVAGIFHRCPSNSSSASGPPEVLVFQRAFGDMGGGLFEFPGGKIEPGETEHEALKRELMEELGIKVNVQALLGSSEFQGDSGKRFKLTVYFVEGPIASIQLKEHESMKWISRSTLVLSEIALGDRPLMELCFNQIDEMCSLASG